MVNKPKVVSEIVKIGKETVKLDSELKKIINNIIRRNREGKEDYLEAQDIAHHIHNLEVGLKRARKIVNKQQPSTSARYLNSLREEVEMIKDFIRKLEKKEKIEKKHEENIRDFTKALRKHTKKLTKEITALGKEIV